MSLQGEVLAAPSAVVEALLELLRSWKLIVAVTLLFGAATAGVSLILPPTYEAKTTLLPPQPPQSLAASALGALGSLGSLAGAAAGVRNPVDQYAALLQTEIVLDRIVQGLGLMEVYGSQYREDARLALARRSMINVGRRDNLISITVTDGDANRSAAIANRYVEELRRLTNELALTESQQRRKFFELQLDTTRRNLGEAQARLQASGIDQGVLRAEPRAAAETYGRLRAEVQAGEVALQRLRVSLTDGAPEIQQQLSALAVLRERLAAAERSTQTSGANTGYIDAYRDLKYHESLFELFSRQFELARVDEARDGVLIQVVDPARPPERRAKPKRSELTLLGLGAGFLLAAIIVFGRQQWRLAAKRRRASAAVRT